MSARETVIDLGPLRAALGDEELLVEVLGVFLSDGASLVATIERQCAAGEYRAVSESAHSLKGASRNVGAGPLGEACATLEAIAKQPAPAPLAVRAAVAALAAHYRHVVEQLATGRSVRLS